MVSVRYRVNSPQVINEVMDGEAVIINLASGDYFSLRGSGAYVWSAIDRSAGVDDIVQAFVDAGAPRAEVDPAVRELVGQLAAEGLIAPVDGEAGAGPPLPAPEGASFERPSLEKFTDMQDLILLDPVHEVDQRGWPHTQPEP